jgi:hypothetical protein
MNITPDFVSTYLFKKLLPISLPFYNPALIFTKAMYFKVTPNHRQVSRAWMVWDMVGGDTVTFRATPYCSDSIRRLALPKKLWKANYQLTKQITCLD